MYFENPDWFFPSKPYIFLSSLHLWILSRLHRPVTWEVSNNAQGAGLVEETVYCNNQEDWHLLTLLKAAGLDSHNIKLPTTQRQGTLFFYTHKLFFKGLNAQTVFGWVALSMMRIQLFLLLWQYFTGILGRPSVPYPPVAASQMLGLQVHATVTLSDVMASFWRPKLTSAGILVDNHSHILLGSHILLPGHWFFLSSWQYKGAYLTSVLGVISLSVLCLSLCSEVEMVCLPYTARLPWKGMKV